jgi:O-antigen ligase
MYRQYSSNRTTDFSRPHYNPARLLTQSYPLRVGAWLIVNMLIAVVMERSYIVATAQALIVVALGIYWLLKDSTPRRVIYVTAYITGAELLWRTSDAIVFWEFGKYSVILLLLFSLFKHQRFFQSPKLPIAYFILLIPSIALLTTFDREAIAFNLSGPLALVVTTIYFHHVKLTLGQLKRLLLVLLAPIIALAFIASISTITAANLEFTASSASRITSAGFGPNQVSSIFGLGIFAAYWYAILEREHRLLRIFVILLAVWLVGQSMLTWSRGGLWTGLGSIAIATLFLLRDRRSLGVVLTASAVIFLMSLFVVFPLLNDFTGGTLVERLRETDLTGRGLIMQADLITFRQHPLFGVGPGQSAAFHAITFRYSASHTEYTRLLSEHGSLGLIALLLLILISIQRLFRDSSPLRQSFTASATAWTLLYMVHAAMRLVAPAYIFGLGGIDIDPSENEDGLSEDKTK